MHKYIKKLQSKEEVVRKQILLGSLIVSMTIVGSVWAYNLTDRIDNKSAEQAKTDEKTTKPFAMFANSAVDAYHNIAASVGNLSFSKKKASQSSQKQVDLIVVDHPTAQ